MPETPSPKRRPGGRSARVGDAVTQTALEHLLTLGYSGLTIRGVARAAGVAETTIYRRWPTVDHLAAAALRRLAEQENPLPDTGTLAGDLRLLLTQIVELLERPEVLRVVRSAAGLEDDEEGVIQSARAAFFEARFANAAAIVQRASARGEIPGGVDAHLIIEVLVAPAYLRALLESRPIDDALIDFSVRTAAQAAATSPIHQPDSAR